MARILAVSSQVARGHVGLSAIVPACQALGHDVIALPTILLSNHPGHDRAAGEHVSPSLLARMLETLDANGWLTGIDVVLTGYLPSAEHVAFAARAASVVRTRSPGVVLLCDAILGDEPKGLYIAQEAAAAIRDMLLPVADIVKANAFEARWLTGAPLVCADDVGATAATSGWRELIVTSMPGNVPGRLANIWTGSVGASALVEVGERAGVPKGTGDLLSGLVAARLTSASPGAAVDRSEILTRAVADLERVIAASVGHDELQLVPKLRGLQAGRP